MRNRISAWVLVAEPISVNIAWSLDIDLEVLC